MTQFSPEIQADIDAIGSIPVIATILEVICLTTGMGFAAVARVTDTQWIACSVRDEIQFGLKPGGELKLETLAGECGISVSHFARSFRRSFGTSAHRYLILKRIEIAKTLLSETTNSLVEIAAQTGFSDQAAFTRAFTNVVGGTPAKWRREHSRRRSFV